MRSAREETFYESEEFRNSVNLVSGDDNLVIE